MINGLKYVGQCYTVDVIKLYICRTINMKYLESFSHNYISAGPCSLFLWLKQTQMASISSHSPVVCLRGP
jgi:hypothetical protein